MRRSLRLSTAPPNSDSEEEEEEEIKNPPRALMNPNRKSAQLRRNASSKTKGRGGSSGGEAAPAASSSTKQQQQQRRRQRILSTSEEEADSSDFFEKPAAASTRRRLSSNISTNIDNTSLSSSSTLSSLSNLRKSTSAAVEDDDSDDFESVPSSSDGEDDSGSSFLDDSDNSEDNVKVKRQRQPVTTTAASLRQEGGGPRAVSVDNRNSRTSTPNESISTLTTFTRNSPAAAADRDRDAETTAVTAPATTRRNRVPRPPKAPKIELLDVHPELGTVWAELEEEKDRRNREIQADAAASSSSICSAIAIREGSAGTMAGKGPLYDLLVRLLPFQVEGVAWMRKQEETKFNGGILADEMGMGKTIQMIALLLSTRSTIKSTLILCPTVAILQWYAELTTRTRAGTFKVLVYHGADRPTKRADLENVDIVLSTYAIVEGGFRRQNYGFKRKGATVKEPSLLHSIKWGRVVLDEAHAIKDRSSNTARAVFALKCERKWSLSGTPLQNRVGELYSLVRFMDCEPFSNYFCTRCPCTMKTWTFSDRFHCDSCGHTTHQHFCWWNREILRPIQNFGAEGAGREAFGKLGLLLDNIMLRRTKIERSDDLGLPPRVVVVRRDVFNEPEEELYESLYTDSRRTFSTYVAANTVLNNYASIFSLLSRMRLAVNHPDLVVTKMNMKAAAQNATLVCGICQEEAEDAIMSKCKHVFCREDARQYILSAPDVSNLPEVDGGGEFISTQKRKHLNTKKKNNDDDDEPSVLCPVCYKMLSIDLTQEEVTVEDVFGKKAAGSSAFGKVGGSSSRATMSIVNQIDLSKWRSSTKIEALVEELTALQQESTTYKSIVFSQFVAFLDLIQWRLSRAGFNVVKLDGRMSPIQRDTVIRSFMTDPGITVFLVSLKAGGVALNLTEASRVFVMDPWWNPAVEDQAFDRIHRLGQHRPIKITRMIIENSIESRILQLQMKKKALFESTVGKDMDALARLSEEDLKFLFVL